MRTLIVSGARALAALDIMRAFHGGGWRVVAVDSMALPPARFSSAVDRFRRIAGPAVDRERFDADVAALLDEEKPHLWIATCEEIFYLAALKAEGLPELPLCAPPLAELLAVHDKARFAEAAGQTGLAPDETIRLTSKEDVARLAHRAGELVFKPVWSRFAERVMVKPDVRDVAWLEPSPHDPWIAQTFLPGEEVCTYGVAGRGQLLLHTAYRPRHRVRAGAGIYFEPAPDEDVRDAVAAFVRSLDWTGQIAFDLRRDASGRWKAIECNPRATSGVHLVPPAALVTAFEGKAVAAAVDQQPYMIGAAMWAFGFAAAVREKRWREWRHDYARARDVASVRGDRLPGAAQFLFLAEGVAQALRHRVGLTRAATRDLEWNGGEEGQA